LAEINWTEEAQRWLKDIHDYIAADNPDAAVGTVNGIFRRAQILKAHPAAAMNTRLNPHTKSEFCCTVIIESPI
jgi:toxin ParE1/3/4